MPSAVPGAGASHLFLCMTRRLGQSLRKGLRKVFAKSFALRKVFAQSFGQPVTLNFGFRCSILSLISIRFDIHHWADSLVENDCLRYLNHCFDRTKDSN